MPGKIDPAAAMALQAAARLINDRLSRFMVTSLSLGLEFITVAEGHTERL